VEHTRTCFTSRSINQTVSETISLDHWSCWAQCPSVQYDHRSLQGSPLAMIGTNQ